jgi:hypothetical protein
MTDYTKIRKALRLELYKRFCIENKDSDLCEAAKGFNDCCDDEGECDEITTECCGTQKFSSAVENIGAKCCEKCVRLGKYFLLTTKTRRDGYTS